MPSIVTGTVICGSDEASEIVNGAVPVVMWKVIEFEPPAVFEAVIAARRLPAPVSAVVVTGNAARSLRDSSPSSRGRWKRRRGRVRFVMVQSSVLIAAAPGPPLDPSTRFDLMAIRLLPGGIPAGHASLG